MPLPSSISRWIDFLWPRACLLCGQASATAVCASCQATLPDLATPQHPYACPRCAVPLPAAAPACGACLAHPPAYDATRAVWRYAEPLAGLIREFKFGGRGHRRFASADFFAATLLASPHPDGDLILPVPLAAARLKQRGFNQALEVARPLARALGLPIDCHSLWRRRDTPPQSRLAWEQRRHNVRDAFECRTDLSGRSVIVIDDVMTSGATLDAVARVLKDHGAIRVNNWVVARTVKAS